MIEYLESLDRQLFLFLNGLNAPALDSFMWMVSRKWFMVPLVLFLSYKLHGTRGWRGVFTLLLFGVGTVLLSDLIATRCFKRVFLRYRPSHNLELEGLVHLLTNSSGEIYRGGKYGFLSSHAATSFGLGMFYFLSFKKRSLVLASLIFGYAFLIGYSRIYLGVHYPSDIICGALLGLLIGAFGWWLLRKLKLD